MYPAEFLTSGWPGSKKERKVCFLVAVLKSCEPGPVLTYYDWYTMVLTINMTIIFVISSTGFVSESVSSWGNDASVRGTVGRNIQHGSCQP